MLGCSVLISSNLSWLHPHSLVDLREEDQTVPGYGADVDDQEHGGGNEGHEAGVHETEHGDGGRDYDVKTDIAPFVQQ